MCELIDTFDYYEPQPEDMVFNPAPTVNNFIQDFIFVSLIIGAIGSGKTLGSIMKWFYLIHLQEPDSNGYKRTRTVVIRNTTVELRDTTIKSFVEWFGVDLKMNWSNLSAVYEDEEDKVHAEILFRALDKPQDMKKLYESNWIGEWYDSKKHMEDRKELGWKAVLGLDEICRDAWNWQQKYPQGYV